jgi:hypothetical protein
MAWTTPKTWAFQEGVESAELNIHLRDNLNALYRVLVRKTADESVANNTMQDDNELFWSIGANETWGFNVYIGSYVNGNADWQHTFNTPSGATGVTMDQGTVCGVAGYHGVQSIGTSVAYGGTSTGDGTIHIYGVVANGSNAGNVNFRWAQLTTFGGDPSIVRAGSFLTAQRF